MSLVIIIIVCSLVSGAVGFALGVCHEITQEAKELMSNERDIKW